MSITTGWRTLAEPTYGIGLAGHAMRLPPGVRIDVRTEPDTNGTVTAAVFDPTDIDPEPTDFYVAAGTLRFMEAG